MIKGYAANDAGEALNKFEYEPKPLGHHDVEVKITHCGICHSDVHLIDNDWQISSFPFIPGHEVVGTVTETGDLVDHLKQGDRVGIGWSRGACLECEFCLQGDENLCSANQATCVGNHGGFADAIRIDGRFAFKVPDNLASENVAPLMCGGITVYGPLKHYEIKPSMKVGVIGIGGLGHMALQFVSAFGCEVTAFSSSPSKEEEARSFGAHHFVSSRDKGALDKITGTLDFVMSTVFVNLDWPTYLNVLKPNGKLCVLGAGAEPMTIPAFPLIIGRKGVVGSCTGGRATINEMLEFAARHDIKAKTEVMPMSDINTAIDKVRKNEARYRMVLKVD